MPATWKYVAKSMFYFVWSKVSIYIFIPLYIYPIGPPVTNQSPPEMNIC
jgi:hypothetical protein